MRKGIQILACLLCIFVQSSTSSAEEAIDAPATITILYESRAVQGISKETIETIGRKYEEEGRPASSLERVRSATFDMSVLVEIVQVRNEGADLREYSAVVQSATFEIQPASGGNITAPDPVLWLAYEKAISQGNAVGQILVDRRNRIRLSAASDPWKPLIMENIGSVAIALFPPLPEASQPFEQGATWRTHPESGQLQSPNHAFCESVKVWPSGEIRVELLAASKVTDSSQEMRWMLEGNPLAVREYEHRGGTENDRFWNRFENSVNILSGSLPVAPYGSSSP